MKDKRKIYWEMDVPDGIPIKTFESLVRTSLNSGPLQGFIHKRIYLREVLHRLVVDEREESVAMLRQAGFRVLSEPKKNGRH